MPDAPTLVKSGESERVELKEQWSGHSALRELAAFANTSVGTYYELAPAGEDET